MKNNIILFLGLLTFASCSHEYIPKPIGYHRVDFNEKEYAKYDGVLPFTFDLPTYSKIALKNTPNPDSIWFNVEFKPFDATIYFTYRSVNNDLGKYLDDAHHFLHKHDIKANSIESKKVIREEAKAYGVVNQLKGNVASQTQFFITDSIHHFLRGALYFNAAPNKDSLRPILQYVDEDIMRLMNSLEWK